MRLSPNKHRRVQSIGQVQVSQDLPTVSIPENRDEFTKIWKKSVDAIKSNFKSNADREIQGGTDLHQLQESLMRKVMKECEVIALVNALIGNPFFDISLAIQNDKSYHSVEQQNLKSHGNQVHPAV